MKTAARSFERWFSNQFPNLYLSTIQKPRNFFRFRTERRLLRGQRLSESEHPSILFFTTQKCASRYVDQIISRLAHAASMVHADYDAYISMVRIPIEQRPFAKERIQTAFQSRGYYYGPFGSCREIPDMENYHVVLQLRDPRDVLTSLYYSTAFSHALINAKIVRRRKEALKMDVDTYVLRTAREYEKIYEDYCNFLITKKHVLFLRYEDMVGDFPNWLHRLSDHIGLKEEKETLGRLQAEADFSVEEENQFSQRRQVTPGDHSRKLQPDTVANLTERFEPSLKALGY